MSWLTGKPPKPVDESKDSDEESDEQPEEEEEGSQVVQLHPAYTQKLQTTQFTELQSYKDIELCRDIEIDA